MSFQSDSRYIISKWLRALSLLSKRQSYIISKRASFQNYSFRRDNHLSSLKDCPQGIIHPLSNVEIYSHFLLILFWHGELCPANHGSPTSSPSRFYLTSSYRNGSALEKRVINHFEVTVIYHLERIVLAPAIVGLSLSYSASCSLSFMNANDNLQRAEWFYHAGANPHFESKVIFISKG